MKPADVVFGYVKQQLLVIAEVPVQAYQGPGYCEGGEFFPMPMNPRLIYSPLELMMSEKTVIVLGVRAVHSSPG